MMKKWTRANYLPGVPLGPDGRRVTAGPEHITLSKNAAKEGMVLLKNENRTLPLCKGDRIALFGKGTIDYVKGGGGSGDVTVPYIRNLYDGLCQVVDPATIFPDTVDFYRKDVQAQYAAGKAPGMIAEPELPDELVRKAAVFTDTAIVSFSRFSGENWDRKAAFDPQESHKNASMELVNTLGEIFEDGDFYLSHAEKAMLDKVCAAFERVIVVLNTGAVMETASLKANPAIDAVLLAWQGGLEGGLAAAELLMGVDSPSGKLADTFARDLADYPSSDSFFVSDDYVEYNEDIYVGYRYFETIPGAAEKVVYPFGYGLSYTTFALTEQKITIDGDEITASVRVCNTGSVPGKEVVQVYFSAPQGKLGKPARQLIGYAKTRLLQPGDEQVVIIRISAADMASYDDLGKVCKSAWLLEKGSYAFYIGTSVRDTVKADTAFVLLEDRIVRQVTARVVPTNLPKRMLADGTYEELPTSEGHDPFKRVLPIYIDGWESTFRGRNFRPLMPGEQLPQLIDVHEGRMALEDFIAKLPDAELLQLISGQPNTGVSNTWGLGNNPLYGIPNITTADGPAGLRVHEGVGVVTTAFPCATLMACTWNTDICHAVGVAAARELKENNIGVWLAPGVNIHRNPLCGRNFEYYSEDPVLTGKQASALVKGVQSERIAATPKHFALNNKESNRSLSDSRASERAIREIYIRQFEIIVKEANPWCIMTSYNIINGYHASTCKDTLTHILREEWDYDGMVMTDWWTAAEQHFEVMAGNDLKMPTGYIPHLTQALEQGLITREALEIAAKHILTLILRID